MKIVDPNLLLLPEILAELPDNTPVVMVNLLRFRDQALYSDGTTNCSGREAYGRYAAIAQKKLAEVGAEVLYAGDANACIIAPPEEQWHKVILVRYPSVHAFADMLAMPDYRAATPHRTAALDDARLITTIEQVLVNTKTL